MSNPSSNLIDRMHAEQLLSQTREGLRRLWLCGLGAYSLATRSSMQTFAALVREGQAMQPKARRQIEETSAELKSSATATIERGEQLVRERFLRPLDFVILATRRDIEQLSLRVIQLSAEVQKLASGKIKSLDKPAAKAEAGPIVGSA
ncbi:phasin family protein [Accumulibacter sp.]|uniref:phasin family protein n=1 Tax=Accumulibacter sp. TaxID=2053492 RepID=UPI0025D2DB29|nr:phasin family protein [Accumulibacter sp.]MCM8610559.1 phasin family protein [Accumulibacter sp.]MCM8634661.1 phasin family protein [Accumulibacter sp.]MCM8641909.1 phasin family protein [Accumulibacter sp.]